MKLGGEGEAYFVFECEKNEYLPSDLKGRQYYRFGDNKYEQNARAYFRMIQQKSKPSDS